MSCVGDAGMKVTPSAHLGHEDVGDQAGQPVDGACVVQGVVVATGHRVTSGTEVGGDRDGDVEDHCDVIGYATARPSGLLQVGRRQPHRRRLAGRELAPIAAGRVGHEEPQTPVITACHDDTLGARSRSDNGCAQRESKPVQTRGGGA